jgi:branched-subunit amino acid aminotransferase/4-amino-4-deoxychorismate lyase
VTCVDVRDARAEGNLARDQGQRLAQRQAVARARAEDAAEALLLEALGEIERGPAAAGDGH